MSILTRLGGNAQGKKPEPPAMPPPPAMADPRALHPAVEEHAINWSNVLNENERLHGLVQKLTNDGEVDRRVLQEKDRALDAERARLAASDRLKEAYLRFAQEILTRGEDVGSRIDDLGSQLKDLRNLLNRVIARAMDAAQNASLPTDFERELKAIIADAQKSENDQESHANGGSQPSA